VSSALAFADDLSVEAQESLRDLLVALTREKQYLGFQYAHWCIQGPTVEANIALAGMAQEELGHATVLDGLLGEDPDHPMPGKDEIVGWNRWSAWSAQIPPLESWPAMVVSCLALEAGVTATLEALKNSTYVRLAQRARKMVQEAQFHILFGVETVRGFSALPGETRRALPAVYGRVLADVENRLEPAKALSRLHALGMLAAGAQEARYTFLKGVTQRFNAACG
jgi:ring-1,2-phenylacetyl-CoA epoxidase subunit PaaC